MTRMWIMENEWSYCEWAMKEVDRVGPEKCCLGLRNLVQVTINMRKEMEQNHRNPGPEYRRGEARMGSTTMTSTVEATRLDTASEEDSDHEKDSEDVLNGEWDLPDSDGNMKHHENDRLPGIGDSDDSQL